MDGNAHRSWFRDDVRGKCDLQLGTTHHLSGDSRPVDSHDRGGHDMAAIHGEHVSLLHLRERDGAGGQ